MTFWSDPNFYAAAVPIAAGVVGVVAVVVRVLRAVVPALRRVGHLVDDLTGEPARPGSPARQGVMERLQELDERTEELRHNGGGSIKDVVHRLDARMARIEPTVADITRRLAVVERQTGNGDGG